MSRSNPVGQKHTARFACPALSAFPALSDPDTAANGRVAKYRLASETGAGNAGFGPRIFTFECPLDSRAPGINPSPTSPSALTLSIEFSADDTTYVASTAAANNSAVTQVVIQPGVRRGFDVLWPPNTSYMRITAIGGNQCEMTIDNDANLERVRPIGLV